MEQRSEAAPLPAVHAAWLALAESPELAWRLAACRTADARCPAELAQGGLLRLLQSDGRVAVTARGGINEYLGPERKAELAAAVQAHLCSVTDPWYATRPRTQLNYGGKGCGQQLWFTDDGSWRVTQPNRLMIKFHEELPMELPAELEPASDRPASDSSSADSDSDTPERVRVESSSSSGADAESGSEAPGKRQRLLSSDGDRDDDGLSLLLPLEGPVLQDIHLLPVLGSHDANAQDLLLSPPPLELALDDAPAPAAEQEQEQEQQQEEEDAELPPVEAEEEEGATHDRIIQGFTLELDMVANRQTDPQAATADDNAQEEEPPESVHVPPVEDESVPTAPPSEQRPSARSARLKLGAIRKLLASVLRLPHEATKKSAQRPKPATTADRAARQSAVFTEPRKPPPVDSRAGDSGRLAESKPSQVVKPQQQEEEESASTPCSCVANNRDLTSRGPAAAAAAAAVQVEEDYDGPVRETAFGVLILY